MLHVSSLRGADRRAAINTAIDCAGQQDPEQAGPVHQGAGSCNSGSASVQDEGHSAGGGQDESRLSQHPEICTVGLMGQWQPGHAPTKVRLGPMCLLYLYLQSVLGFGQAPGHPCAGTA